MWSLSIQVNFPVPIPKVHKRLSANTFLYFTNCALRQNLQNVIKTLEFTRPEITEVCEINSFLVRDEKKINLDVPACWVYYSRDIHIESLLTANNQGIHS